MQIDDTLLAGGVNRSASPVPAPFLDSGLCNFPQPHDRRDVGRNADLVGSGQFFSIWRHCDDGRAGIGKGQTAGDATES